MTSHRIFANAISNCNDVSVTGSTFNITIPAFKPIVEGPESQELRKVADWFTSINFRSIQIDTFDKRTPGTGTWFIESPEFKKWRSMDTGVLWGEGLPGAGKTVLSSIAIDHLQTRFASDQDTAIVFAYCRHTDRYSLRDLFASFVKQLAEDHPSLFSTVKSVYTDHQSKATQPSGPQLQKLLQALFGSFKKVYIIIDALDEVPDDTRIDMLRAISTYRACLLLTSRPLQHVHCLPDAAHIRIDSENRDDIKFFIDKRIEETNLANLLRGRELLKEEIRTKLLQMSEGMFLVAALQIEKLKDSISVAKLRKAANSLPLGLNDLYACTWGRIKEQIEDKVTLATNAIIWLAYAYRSLTIEELQYALAVSDETEKFDKDDVSAMELIVSVCCGLVVVDGQSKIVHLVHYTTYDFFRDPSSTLCSRPHTFLTTRCLAYLSAFNFLRKTQLSKRGKLDNFLRKSPLLSYAYRYWGIHAEACYGEAGLPIVVSNFVAQCHQYPGPNDENLFPYSGPLLFKPCHIAAYYGLTDVIPATTEWCNDFVMGPGYTPLMLASARGHEEFVKLLLAQNNIAINTRNYWKQTALLYASRGGHVAIVKLLLSRNDIDINIQNFQAETAFTSACRRGYEAVVKLFLSRNDINTNVPGRESPFFSYSRLVDERIFKLLLSRNDIDVNKGTALGDTALILAFRGGLETTAKLLFSRNDIDVNVHGAWNETALIAACRNGHVALVKLLLSRNDVDINKLDSEGWSVIFKGETALISACRIGHEALVRLLLSRDDIDINKQASKCEMERLEFGPAPKCETALISASRGGHEAIVKLLLSRNDIDINKQDSEGETALDSASRGGHEAIVKLLLSQNDVKTINKQASEASMP